MDKEYIRQILPEVPRDGLLKWTRKNSEGELGANFLVWRSERVPVYDMDYLMSGRKKPRYERVAACTCLCCGSQFVTEHTGSTLEFWISEDGEWWNLDPQREIPSDDEGRCYGGYMVDVNDGTNMTCPMCYETLTTIQAKNLRGGRIKQLLVASIEVVDQYAAVVYWLVRREISENSDRYMVSPRDAYVLDERGTIHRYTHTTGGGSFAYERNHETWRMATSKRDSIDTTYHDWGSICNKKAGGIFWPEVQDLEGTTAEKTGLQAYADYDGTYSVAYLKLWKKYRAIENLVNTGWTKLVETLVKRSFSGYEMLYELNKVIDITRTKPHEMLGMSKGDFKQIRRGGYQWGFEEQSMYQVFRKMEQCSPMEFRQYLATFKKEGLRAVQELHRRYGDANMEKLTRYLHKQNMLPHEVRVLLDTRNAALALAGGRSLSAEELWPRNLSATHDRLTRQRVLQISPDLAEKYQKGFDEARERYKELQWNDGELCVILPRGYADLVREGNVLRHCVGGYSESHIQGNHTIFFIRHYRRPERCYYTLDINMQKGPVRNQLHGYGNERHGVHKEHRHTIPKKVLDFCDRWEREVLQPWWREHQNEQKEGKTA